MEPVEVGDRGTVVNYTLVHLPVQGLTLELPFAVAWIELDGTDVSFPHLLGDMAPDAISVGLRVEAVWAPEEELAPTWETITHFRRLEA